MSFIFHLMFFIQNMKQWEHTSSYASALTSEKTRNHNETQQGQMLTSIINYSLNLHQRADCLMGINTNCYTFASFEYWYSWRRWSVRLIAQSIHNLWNNLYIYIGLLIATCSFNKKVGNIRLHTYSNRI